MSTQPTPVLSLRDVVVYPHMVIPLFVGRERSILALDKAMDHDKRIVLVTQRSAEIDDPAEEDLFKVGTLATVLSWIPPYTPFVMMNRAAADPPMFDRVGTMILLIATTAFVLWLSGRIFRIGILRTGQPPKFKELIRWVRNA